MVLTLLDVTNAARSAAAAGDAATVAAALADVEARLRLPRHKSDLHGRKAVDAAFNMALAGVSTPHLFTELIQHAESEVQRWGRRKSCSSMALAQLAERTAAAGFLSPLGLYDLIGTILQE